MLWWLAAWDQCAAEPSGMDTLSVPSQKLTELTASQLTGSLTTIDASFNSLIGLPVEIGNCALLEELLLFGNQLKTLPVELARLKRLRVLNLFKNKLSKLPVDLGKMDSLVEVPIPHDKHMRPVPHASCSMKRSILKSYVRVRQLRTRHEHASRQAMLESAIALAAGKGYTMRG